MGTSFLTQWLSDHEIKAICWTLIHSLWIGMIMALLAGLVITFTRKSKANIRYRALCGILILFIAAIGVTYYFEVRTISTSPLTFNLTAATNHSKTIFVIKQDDVTPKPGVVNQTVGFLNQNMNIIFIVWLLFFMLKSLKMVSGLLYIQRIRNYKVHAVAEEFKRKIEIFSNQIGITQVVTLMQSELVKVPVAVGWLKPLILLPMGIVLQLSSEQLESILWHELAHIRRRDYLVNILQGLVETVFFFNPGLLWVSSLIRAEREACCDDIVLSRMNRKANYLEALLSFGYEDNSRTTLVMSIGGGNQLRDRLKRMVNQENKRLSMAEKVVLAVGLVLLSAFTTLPKADKAVQYLSHIMTKRSHDKVRLKSDSLISVTKDWKHIDTPLAKKPMINKDSLIHFTSLLFKNTDSDLDNGDINAKDDKGNQFHLIIANSELTSLEINGEKVKESELSGYQYIVGNIKRTMEEKRHFREADLVRFKAANPNAKFKITDDVLVRGQQRFKTDSIKMVGLRYEARRNDMRKDSSYGADLRRVNNVLEELVKAGVVPNIAAVKWFGLTDTELIVNGVKQPDDLQARLKRAYDVRKDYGLYYGPVEMHGSGVFIDSADSFVRLRARPPFKAKQLMLQDKKLLYRDTSLKARQLQAWPARKELMMQQRDAYKTDAMEDRRNYKPGISLPPIIANIVTDLLNENVVKSKSDLLSFNLTNSFLTVNGVKQSEELHRKLKMKYLLQSKYRFDRGMMNDPHFGLHYDAKQGGMGIGISIDNNDQ